MSVPPPSAPRGDAPRAPTASGAETRGRLLDAAEGLFAEQGHRASLRDITSAAGANLASVSYHFGSKEGLLRAVVRRRVDPMNDGRLALLDRFEAEAGGAPLPVERVVEAFVRPALDPDLAPPPSFMQLMAHLHASQEDFAQGFFREVFGPLVLRFLGHLRASLPDVPPHRLHLRLHLLVGAMVHALMSQYSPKVPLPEDLCTPLDPEDLLEELIGFCSVGFRHA